MAGLLVVNVSVEEADGPMLRLLQIEGHFLEGRDLPRCAAAHETLVLRDKIKCVEHWGTVPVGSYMCLTSHGQSAGLDAAVFQGQSEDRSRDATTERVQMVLCNQGIVKPVMAKGWKRKQYRFE